MRTGGSAGRKRWSSWQFAGARIAHKSFVPSVCSTGMVKWWEILLPMSLGAAPAVEESAIAVFACEYVGF
jgi:hypothetical protein